MDGTSAQPFWSCTPAQLFKQLNSSPSGLDAAAAARRLRDVGPNLIRDEGGPSAASLLLKQFASPLVLILLFGALVSFALRDASDGIIILVIVGGSALLSFWQEWNASRAVAALKARLALTSRAFRGGKEASVPAADIVPGDIVLLSAGNLVPADGLVLEAQDFLVTQAALTGESMPVEKKVGMIPAAAPISECTNSVFTGSSVRSGSGRVLIVRTGPATEYGAIAAELKQTEPETDFERGVRHFGTMLLRAMFVLVAFVLTVNALLGRPFVESMLFSVALAVGLSPELLPAIVTVTLSAGARRLSSEGVIVRRLESLENFGSMNVLCTDKTGTITTGEVALSSAVDPDGNASSAIKRLAFLNAALETGIANPLDQALVAAGAADKLDTAGVTKVDEIPYDFQRRRLTVVIEEQERRLLITKGAFDEVLDISTSIEGAGKTSALTAAARARLAAFYQAQGEQGFRVLAVATREVQAKEDYTIADERELTFAGFLLFLDPPKETASDTLAALHRSGIATKIISGDNRHVTAHIARIVGLNDAAMITGEQLGRMSDDALAHNVRRTDLFVEIEPQQKERIIRALQKAGYSVGYMGDGINDAPALRAADIGISVDDAVDVARESADIVLLKSDLGVLLKGVEDGRRTFANTLKYIDITISANFGNMISMALATPLLAFLPLLPKQILLNNFLSDLPSLSIATDNVDSEVLRRPQRWDIHSVEHFMVVFGLASSLFDFITFGALLLVFRASETEFQTGWFFVSLITELLVVMILRTHRLAWESTPGRLLLLSTLVVFAATLGLTYWPPADRLFGMARLPAPLMASLLAIVLAYIAFTEALKHWFYGRRDAKLRSR